MHRIDRIQSPDGEAITKAFDSFYTWVHSSLDSYKVEYIQMLFPVYMHCYLDMIEGGYNENGTA